MLQKRLAGSTVTHVAVIRTLIDALAVSGRLHLTRYPPAAAEDTATVLSFPTTHPTLSAPAHSLAA